jgi:16S rRNA (adenine1518-N6/adenine1519-N6)-dimethyltransferase
LTELLGAQDIRRLAQQAGVVPTKKWGQNFVIDPNTVRRIAASADITRTDSVLEVGPGLGSLTLALLPLAAAVTCIEVDQRLATQLPQTVAEFAAGDAHRLTVICADALSTASLPVAPTVMVANLPYNIAVPVVLHALAAFPTITQVLVMVQQEVANRLTASPGSKEYGVPSVKAHWYGNVTKAGSVPRTVFWPVPNVDSGLVRLIRQPPPGDELLRNQVFRLVDAAFGQRRKMLRTALAEALGGSQRAQHLLEAAGIDPMARGEQLALADYLRLAREVG